MSRNCVCNVLLVAVLTVGLSAEVSTAASDLPSNQQVLAFLTETVDWYRHRAIERQIAIEPSDVVFIEDNRPIAAQVVQLSFDFARAAASGASMSTAADQVVGAIASDSSPEMAQFVQQQTMFERASLQASQEIEDIKKKLLTARGADRRKLQAALDATQSRLDVLKAGLASLHEVIEFVRSSGSRQTGDLQTSIEDLARTVPDVTNPAMLESQTRNSDIGPAAKPQGSGILSLMSKVSALGAKIRILDDRIGRTDKLRQSSNNLHHPLLAYLHKRVPIGAQDLQATDLHILQQQKAQLDALRLMVEALAPAVVALDKQNVLLAAYSSHLKSWRAAVASEDEKAWKSLIWRLVGVAVALGRL
jgi:hypothetical protein